MTSVELLQNHLREEPFCQGDIVLVNVPVPGSAVELPVKEALLVSLAPNALDEERISGPFTFVGLVGERADLDDSITNDI